MKKIKKIFSFLGPGFITGASDDDPSGIGTYSQTGAQFGYSQLWLTPFSLPFMIIMQEMAGRIGIVTGKGLSGVIRKYYSKKILYSAVFILLIANTVNIGANLGAMAASARLVFGLNFYIWLLLMTIITLVLEVFVSYRLYSRYLKYLAFSLFAYIITAFVIKQDWGLIAISAVIPTFSLNTDYLLNVVAFLGTTISAYLFFWQANEEVEEEVENHQIRSMGVGIPKIGHVDIKKMRIDTVIGMFFSNAVSFFIIVTAASTLGAQGIRNITTADQAAQALRPLAGDFAFILFALGIIGTGLLAIPILAGSASYALSEVFGWHEGLYKKLRQAHGFYGVITLATLVGLLVNFTPIKPFQMLYYTAVLNGIAAPPIMILIMLISNNKKIMGNYRNSRLSNIGGWTIALIMSGAAILLLLSFLNIIG